MKKILFIVTLFIILTFLAVWGYLQTTHAQKMILSFVTKVIKEKTGHDVEIETLSLPLPFNLIAFNVKVKEREKIWLSIDEVNIFIPYWELMTNGFTLTQVSLSNVHFYDLPPKSSTVDTHLIKNASTSLWNTFPYYLKISQIHITNLTTSQKLLSHEFTTHVLPLDLDGSILFNSQTRVANMDLSVKQHGKINQTATHVHFTCQDANQFLFHLDLLESKQGFISQVMNLALPYEILLGIEGKMNSQQMYEGDFNLNFLDEFETILEEKIHGKFSYARDNLDIHSISGSVKSLSLDGEIQLDTNDFKIHQSALNFALADCSQLKNHFQCPLDGSIKAFVALSGPLQEPIIDFKISGDQVKIGEHSIENLTGKVALQKSTSGLVGNPYLSFEYRNTKFKGDSVFRWDDQAMSLTGIHADYGKTQFKGDIKYILNTQIFEGKLDAFAEDSGIFESLFDINFQGTTDLVFTFYGTSSFAKPQAVQNMDFTIQTDKARYNTFFVEKAVLSGILRSIFKDPNVDVTLTAKHALYNGWRLNELTAETFIDPSKNVWPFKISTNESHENDLSAQAKGHWYLTPEELDVHLEHFQGKIKSHHFNLQDPLTLFMQKDVFDLSPVSLTIGQGSLYAAVDYKTDQAHATTRLHHVPLEIFYPKKFILPFTGTLSGEAYLFGTPGELTGKIQAQLAQIKILDDAFEHMPLFEATLSGTIETSHIAGSAQIAGVTPNPIEIQAELPIRTSLNPPSLHVDELAPISAHIKADGDIAPLLQLLVIETSSLSGKTSVALDITGTFKDPHVAGDIIVTNGAFESINTGAVFHHLNAHLQAHDKILVLNEFKALDLNDGVIQGNGVLDLKREEGFPFSLNLQLSKIRILNLDFVKAIASGEVVVTGNSHSGKITGQLVTDSVQATIPEQASALAHSLDVKYINLPKGVVSPVFTTSRPRWPLEFDVQIDVQKNATIKAKNLSSFWHGGVKVSGMSHLPQLFGDFKIIKGEYQYNGQTFDIKEGTISFAGEPDKKTTLYVIASKDLGKIVAEVILKGPVKDPLIAFRSNPPMSQREILSWILFGRGSTDITPFQGSELSQSISHLTKEGQKKPDMLTKIRDTIGLDRIDISKTEGNESNEVSLQVGKYISRGVLVKINKSITSQANQVGIEANVFPNIKAEAQVGDDSSTQLQLKWKRDY